MYIRSWEDFSKLIDVSKKYAYLLVTQNRYDVWSHMKITSNNDLVTESSVTSDDDDNDSADEMPSSINVSNFYISFSKKEILTLIRNVEYERKDDRNPKERTYQILAPFEWTHVVQEKFFTETRSCCCIAFKRCKIQPQGVVYLKIEGSCKMCDSNFVGTLYNDPNNLQGDEDAAKLYCVYTGNFRYAH